MPILFLWAWGFFRKKGLANGVSPFFSENETEENGRKWKENKERKQGKNGKNRGFFLEEKPPCP